jgi:hypothetical protein
MVYRKKERVEPDEEAKEESSKEGCECRKE